MCGIFGVWGHKSSRDIAVEGIFALQHRGQESAGLSVLTDDGVKTLKDMGTVMSLVKKPEFASLVGSAAIAHTRYSTTGSSNIQNAQPLEASISGIGRIAVGHNGNLVNSIQLRNEFQPRNWIFPIFTTSTDTEILLTLLAKYSREGLRSALRKALRRIEGAYCFVLLTDDTLIAARDLRGFRPLFFGKIGNARIVASETCAFDKVGGEVIREILPGEILYINDEGEKSEFVSARNAKQSFCAFELIYFARPDSTFDSESVHNMRKALGRQLAIEHPVEGDAVVPIPDSGTSAAIGYSEESGIPLDMAFVRSHYVGRTFIQPTTEGRTYDVRMKLSLVKSAVAGKRVIVVDDSIVRGTTMKNRIDLLRKAGAKEVHIRVSCPPIISPCYYGIDFPSYEELIAARMSIEEIRKHIGADSLGYLSIEGMLKCLGGKSESKRGFCTACWTGKYPTKIDKAFTKTATEKCN